MFVSLIKWPLIQDDFYSNDHYQRNEGKTLSNEVEEVILKISLQNFD